MNHVIRSLAKRRRKGVILILFTMMMLFVVLPAVGLALDAGILFVIKDKMQTAADGASLAAARSLSRGIDFASQQVAATDTARKVYHMNMENGWLGLQSTADPAVTFPAGAPQSMTVRVDAVVQAPTYFMRILGPQSVTLRSNSQTTRRFVNLMLVLDRSTSLALSNSCDPLKSAATDFAKAFVNGTDNLGLITFGTTYRTDFALANDFLTRSGGGDIPSLISNLDCSGYTNSASGYSLGARTLVNFNQAGALNVLVYFTDGQPTAVHLPAIPITGAHCNNSSARSGVVADVSNPMGISIALEPQAPGSVPASDWQRAINTGDGLGNPTSAGCKFATGTDKAGSGSPTPYGFLQDTNRLAQGGTSAFVDAFGNSLIGSQSVTVTGSGATAYIPVTPSNALTQIPHIAENALVSAASRYRTLSTANNTKVVTYTVGLGNTSGPPNVDLLQDIANDPLSSTYDHTYPPGEMIYASSSDQLQSAFSRLASEVLRISM